MYFFFGEIYIYIDKIEKNLNLDISACSKGLYYKNVTLFSMPDIWIFPSHSDIMTKSADQKLWILLNFFGGCIYI